MGGLALLLISFVVLAAAYWGYGRWLERTWGVDPKAPTPAHARYDGVDYAPARRSVVFGHEFASIAGAAPIIGPIMAAATYGFGWLPVLAWILAGGVFVGAVQDFASLYASVKNGGRSIGAIIEAHIGRAGKRLFLAFVWLFSILVVAAFADIVAKTFKGFDDAGAPVAANGAVATTSCLFVAAAVAMGIFLQRAKPSGPAAAVTAVAMLAVCIAAGLRWPWYMDEGFWLHAVFVYIFVASVTPVWILLQPRDYLNAFLLVAMIGAAFVGVLVARPDMNLPAFTGFVVDGRALFPVLFVTVACGAVSGFHSLVAAGTASKQIDNERDMLPVSYGAMLLESLLAVLALVAVGALATAGKAPEGTPPEIFANAVAGFLAVAGLPADLARTLILLAISAFALTSLDSVARVGRLAFQELFVDGEPDTIDDQDSGRIAAARRGPIRRLLTNRYVATAATLAIGYALARRGYQDIWPLFGSANQLLAALALLACALFLKRSRRKAWMLYVPVGFMLAVTFAALGLSLVETARTLPGIGDGRFDPATGGIPLAFTLLLLGLGVVVAWAGIRRLAGRGPAPE